jgi:hypothetical protein
MNLRIDLEKIIAWTAFTGSVLLILAVTIPHGS